MRYFARLRSMQELMGRRVDPRPGPGTVHNSQGSLPRCLTAAGVVICLLAEGPCLAAYMHSDDFATGIDSTFWAPETNQPLY